MVTDRPRRLRCLVVGALSADARAVVHAALPDVRLELVTADASRPSGAPTAPDLIWHCFGEPGAVARALDTHQAVTWLHTSAAGIDLLREVIADRPGLTVTHGAGISAVPIAEFVVACLLAHAKRLLDLAAQHRHRCWRVLDLRELQDLQVVICGLGTIGSAVALRLAPFGARVTGVRRDVGRGVPAGVDQVVGPDQLRAVCAGADALVLAAPLTPATRGLVGAEVLRALAPGSVVVNVARGGLVDEAALLEGLAAGRPAAAHLDTLTEEPLPRSSPLWSTPGVLVTPHTSWSSPRFGARSAQLFADQVRRRLDGRPLRNVADLAAGY